MWLYRKKKDDEKDIQRLQEAIRIYPDYAEEQHSLIWAHAAFERWKYVIEACKLAICSEPDYAVAHGNLGVVYDAVGDRNDTGRRIVDDLMRVVYDAVEDRDPFVATVVLMGLAFKDEYKILKDLDKDL